MKIVFPRRQLDLTEFAKPCSLANRSIEINRSPSWIIIGTQLEEGAFGTDKSVHRDFIRSSHRYIDAQDHLRYAE